MRAALLAALLASAPLASRASAESCVTIKGPEEDPGVTQAREDACKRLALQAIRNYNSAGADDAAGRKDSKDALRFSLRVLGDIHKKFYVGESIDGITPDRDPQGRYKPPPFDQQTGAFLMEISGIAGDMEARESETRPAPPEPTTRGESDEEKSKAAARRGKKGLRAIADPDAKKTAPGEAEAPPVPAREPPPAKAKTDAITAELNLPPDPKPAALTETGGKYAGAGLPGDALRLYEDSEKKAANPDAPGAPKPSDYASVGQQLLEQGDAASARRAADRSLALRKDNPDALSLRARLKAGEGDRDGAVADAQAALRLDPSNRMARLILGHADELSRAGSRRHALDFGGAGEAGALAAGAAGNAASGGGRPGPAGAVLAAGPLTPAQVLQQRAHAKLGLGDLTGALMEASRAIDADPKSAAGYALRAKVSNRLKNWTGAFKDATQALALDPANAAALRERAYALIQLGNYPAALADLEKAVALEPGNGLGWLYRAMALEGLGRADEAIRDYRKAMELDPALAPLAEEALKRLGASPSPARSRRPLPGRGLFYGGVAALALSLILLGLFGTEPGRRLTTTARALLSGRRGGEDAVLDAPGAFEVGPGTVIGGHLTIVRELGRGGMGVVYEAHDAVLQRRVAAKRLLRDASTTSADLERFVTEARLVAQLKHPNLAEIHSVVSEPDLFLVFEFVDGRPLDAELAGAKRLEPAAARRVLAEVCAALDYAHARRIIHRDLKPSNVMVGGDGSVKVMDFGIAHQSQGLSSFTKTLGAGTPPYMAPEQALGSVSKASDFYALAVMAYEMLGGRRPFPGPDFLEPKLRGEFEPVTRVHAGLPRGLDAFFARALHPDPTKRLSGGPEFLGAFDAALRG